MLTWIHLDLKTVIVAMKNLCNEMKQSQFEDSILCINCIAIHWKEQLLQWKINAMNYFVPCIANLLQCICGSPPLIANLNPFGIENSHRCNEKSMQWNESIAIWSFNGAIVVWSFNSMHKLYCYEFAAEKCKYCNENSMQ